MGFLLLAALLLAAGLVLGWNLRGTAGRGLPALILAGHRALACRLWARRSRKRGGRPRIDPGLIALIRRISRENPSWGAPRIHGELEKLGFTLCERTLSKYMPPKTDRPTPGWKTFLDIHARDIIAIDMLCVWTWRFERLYALVALSHHRRRILHIEVCPRPTALWLAQQITETFPWDNPADLTLIRDNDPLYGRVFRRRLKAMGIRDKPTWPPRSPWQNGYAERLIGSIRRECLDQVIVLGDGHLRRLLREYADYYNSSRTHLGLAKDTPDGRPVEVEGEIISTPVLGGLHHRYGRRKGW